MRFLTRCTRSLGADTAFLCFCLKTFCEYSVNILENHNISVNFCPVDSEGVNIAVIRTVKELYSGGESRCFYRTFYIKSVLYHGF